MKRIVSLLILTVILSLSAASCAKNDGNNADILTYKYNYDLSEYIDLGEYKNLPAEGYRFEITDEDIEAQVLSTRSFYSKLIDVTDRGAILGDTVYIDYSGTVGGEVFEGEEDCELTLGTNTFPADFENAIVGAVPETSLSVDFTFPDPYPASPDYSGAEAHFDITVHNVCEQKLPEYGDDFVRGYLGYESVEDFENSLRVLLESSYRERYYQYVIDQIWDTVMDNTAVKKLPENEVNEMREVLMAGDKANAAKYGLELSTYIAACYDNMTEDEYYENIGKEAEYRIKDEMVCYSIARAEGLTLSDEEYSRRATQYALDVYKLDSLDAFEAVYGKDRISEMLLFEITKEKVADYANVTYND